jgi:hypothetical protein
LTIRQLIHHKKLRKQKLKYVEANMSLGMGRYYYDLKIAAPYSAPCPAAWALATRELAL